MEKSSPTSFGEMLKKCRKRQGLTQLQLARKLGIHQNTLGAWERGDYLPATRGMILELAKCLSLNAGETRDLLDAGLITITSRWSMPQQRNPFFIGRQEVLQQIHAILSDAQNTMFNRSCALSGLCGIGKTQTAIEYVYRYFSNYSAICWINADTEESMLSSFTASARVLAPLAQCIQDLDDVVTIVLNWFNTHSGWLLIFDNVDDIALLKRFLPSARSGSLLLTTRLSAMGTLARPFPLKPLSYEESMHLLFHRSGLYSCSSPSTSICIEDKIVAKEIVVALDGLPLALDQAAAYIEESHCSLADYLHLLLHNTAQMLQMHPTSTTYPHSVAEAFTITFQRLQQHNQHAAHLLTLCCFLSPDEISEKLLILGKSQLDAELQSILSDPIRLNATFKDLLAYALLYRDPQTNTLSVHRLLQTVLQERLPEETQRAWIELLVRMLDQVFFIEQGWLDVEDWSWCEQLLPHIQRVYQLADRLKLASPEFSSLLCKTATYLFQRAHQEAYVSGSLTEAKNACCPVEWQEEDLFERFLQDRCLLSAQAICRAASLWQAYQQWVQLLGKGRSLSRQAFTFQLKALGCQPGRTNTHRIWHGIELKPEV